MFRFRNDGSNPFPWLVERLVNNTWRIYSRHNTRELLMQLIDNHFIHFPSSRIVSCDVLEDRVVYQDRLTREVLAIVLV
jgi:hypothetical protein